MERREELEQQLWEFVFDLLSPEQAETIRRQITSDPEVARLYAQTRLQADIVAQAVRLRHAPIPLTAPDSDTEEPAPPATEGGSMETGRSGPSGLDDQPTPVRPRSSGVDTRGRFFRAAQWGNWLAAAAATLLVGYSGYAYFRPASPLREVAFRSAEKVLIDQPVHTTIFGPDKLQPAPANYFTVVTQSAEGYPRPAQVNVTFYDRDRQVTGLYQCQTDSNGVGLLETTGFAPSSSVEMFAQPVSTVSDLHPARVRFSVRDEELSTHLATDRPLYRPGESIRYRTVTLSRYDLQIPPPTPVEVRLLDPSGQIVADSLQTEETKSGVASGQFALPAQTPIGRYEFVASSPDKRFAEVRRSLQIRPYRTPQLKKDLDFVRDSYAAGEEVVADLTVERADGTVVGKLPLEIVAEVDGEFRPNMTAETDDRGRYRIHFDLPQHLAQGKGVLRVNVGDDPGEQIVAAIPIRTEAVSVDFFPESGDLVAGVENRVYFFAHDASGQPVHIQGRVRDDSGNEVATLQTVRDGRGVFSFRPAADRTYRLQLETPLELASDPVLPATSERQFLTLDAGPGVFDAGSSLEIGIRAARSDRSVLVTAICRGSQVGQTVVTAEQFAASEPEGVCTVSLPLHDEASGVIRLTGYDCTTAALTPVAERLVYRRPGKRLQIEVAGVTKGLAPGSQVDLSLRVTDEQGEPRSALLGVSVVDEGSLSLVRDGSASLTTHFWLLSQIGDHRGLEDANFYLQDGAEAARALDLLLGTQGWRRFEPVPRWQLAQVRAGFDHDDHLAVGETIVPVADEPAAPRRLADNEVQAKGAVSRELERLQSLFQSRARQVVRILFFGGLVLLVSLGLLAAVRRTTGIVWMFATGMGALCLVLGGVWMAAEIDRSYPVAHSWKDPAEGAPVLARAEPQYEALTSEATRGEREEKQKKDVGDHFEALSDTVRDREPALVDLKIEEAEEAVLELAEEAAEKAAEASPVDRLEALPEMDVVGEPAPAAESRAEVAEKPSERFLRRDRIQPEKAAEAPSAPAAALEPKRRNSIASRAARSMGAQSEQPAVPAPRSTEIDDLERTPRRLPQADVAERYFQEQAPKAERSRSAGFGGAVAADEPSDEKLKFEEKMDRDESLAAGRGVRVGQRPLAEEEPKAPRPAPTAAPTDAPAAAPTAVPPAGSDRQRVDDDREATSPVPLLARRYTFLQTIPGVPDRIETVYWNPLLDVRDGGPEAIQFTLPDATTTYRLLINGHTQGRLGTCQESIDTAPQGPSGSAREP